MPNLLTELFEENENLKLRIKKLTQQYAYECEVCNQEMQRADTFFRALDILREKYEEEVVNAMCQATLETDAIYKRVREERTKREEAKSNDKVL